MSFQVGVRVPAHPIASELIKQSQRPIAAPSANRFGSGTPLRLEPHDAFSCRHVSPTKAGHVMADLSASPMLIIDGDEATDHTCRHGIESTVCKVCCHE